MNQSKNRKKRSNVDFKKHELHIVSDEKIKVHNLKLKDTIMNNVKFINTNGILVVIGDFGNWIFCRQFIPSKDGFVSDHYWCEKLQIDSVQEPFEYNADETLNYLKSEIRKGLKEYGYSGDKLHAAKEFFNELIDKVYSEDEYLLYAHSNLPNFMDFEQVPYIKTILPRLSIIFDAFEEICSRIKE